MLNLLEMAMFQKQMLLQRYQILQRIFGVGSCPCQQQHQQQQGLAMMNGSGGHTFLDHLLMRCQPILRYYQQAAFRAHHFRSAYWRMIAARWSTYLRLIRHFMTTPVQASVPILQYTSVQMPLFMALQLNMRYRGAISFYPATQGIDPALLGYATHIDGGIGGAGGLASATGTYGYEAGLGMVPHGYAAGVLNHIDSISNPYTHSSYNTYLGSTHMTPPLVNTGPGGVYSGSYEALGLASPPYDYVQSLHPIGLDHYDLPQPPMIANGSDGNPLVPQT